MRYADFLAFLAPEGEPPVADQKLTPDLLYVGHLTSAPPWLHSMEEVLEYHRGYAACLERQGMQIVETAWDLNEEERGVIKILLGLQNPPDDADVERLYEAGIRTSCIAYEGKNPFGGGFAVQEAGLTSLGAGFVYDCARSGVIVDLSHASHETARGALRIAPEGTGIVASHVGCFEVYPHPRNLPDDVLWEIVERGGVVGISTLTFILHGESNGLEPFMEHLCHAINVCGEEGVVIGGDGHYCTQDLNAWEAHIQRLSARLDTLGQFSPRFPHHPLELNTVRRMAVLEENLGWLPTQARERILGGNLLRFLNENLL